jgi:septum site-determining protein MinD
MLDIPVIGTIPEDPEVRKSIHSKGPVVYRKPNSPAAIAFRNLAANIAGLEFELAAEGRGVVHMLKRFFGVAE